MKKKILLILPIIVLIILIVVITISNSNTLKIEFNTDLKISTNNNKVNSDIQKLSNNRYSIEEIDTKTLTNDEEKAILETAYNITNAFNDIEKNNYVYEVEKYAIRIPSMKLGEDSFSNREYKEWFDKVLTIETLANLFRSRLATFEKINGAKITYASSKRSIVQVYVDNYSITYGTTQYGLDAIFEYEIVYEEISKMYKVDSMAIEWVKDLNDYYQQTEINERAQNKNNTTALSNVSTYIPNGFTNFDYSKLKTVNNETFIQIYNQNKDNVVIIDSVTENGVTSGSSSGFYIRSGILVTSYTSIYSMIENGAARYYAVDTNDKVHEIEGIVAAYPNINIIMLKLKEEHGTKVTIGDSNELEKNDPIVVISSSLGLKSSIKLGIYFDSLNDDYKILRTSLPLVDGDSGSAVFNLKGEVIAINSSVSSSDSQYNSGLNNATDINILKEVIDKINEESFKDIKVTKFSEFNDLTKLEIKNEVSDKVWEKYEKLPIITNYVPLNLYSAYSNDKYLIIRYKQDVYSSLDNNDVLDIYKKYLMTNSYKKISDNVYSNEKITIRLQNNLGYIIIIVEGVI